MRYIDNYGRIVASDELYHYGILGQKWGVRRYQPYPSDYHGDGEFTGKSNASGSATIVGSNKRTSSGAESTSGAFGEKNGSKKKLDKKKALKIGATIAGTALVGVGAYKFHSSGAAQRMASKGSRLFHKYGSLARITVGTVGSIAIYKGIKDFNRKRNLRTQEANNIVPFDKNVSSKEHKILTKAGNMALDAANYTVKHPLRATIRGHLAVAAAKSIGSTVVSIPGNTVITGKNVANRVMDRHKDLHPDWYVPNENGGFTKAHYTRKG